MLQLLSNPVLFVVYLLALFSAITIHEFSHALVADKLGDPTPRLQGRVSLNPLAHVDRLGLLFLLLVGFGWGRPVEFDPFNLKNPRRDAALISLAGPVSNLILASFLAVIYKFTLVEVLYHFIYLNVILAIFNLLPIHPLDGFKIVGGVLPREKAHEWYDLARYGMIFLIFLILPIGGSSMLSKLIGPPIDFIMRLLVGGGGGII